MLTNKLNMWISRNLSLNGKLTIINTLALVLLTYLSNMVDTVIFLTGNICNVSDKPN